VKHIFFLILILLSISACSRKLRQKVQVFSSPDKVLEAQIISEYGGMSQWRSKTFIKNVKTGVSEMILQESGASATSAKWLSANKLQVIACSANIQEFKSYIFIGDRYDEKKSSISILIDLQTTEIDGQGEECKISDRDFLQL
jgi:hypothetical protein